MSKQSEKKVAKLTDKQELFCQEYLVDLNATQAAIRAGYSEKTAYSIGQENLNKPEIQEKVQALQKELADSLKITREKVLAEYAKMAFFDIRKAFTDEGALKPVQELDDETAGGIAGIETYEEKEQAGEETFVAGLVRKVKIADKRAALDSICKVLGYNSPDKSEVNLGITWDEQKTYDK